jgi:hypothetical protein
MPETREQKARRLADLIIDRMRAKGICTDDDLFRAGFTTDDLDDYGALARTIVESEYSRHQRRVS